MAVNFKPHPKQWEVLDSAARFTLASGGIQSGKTTSGAVWLIRLIQQSKFEGTYLIGAPNYKILNQSTLPKLIEMAGGMHKLGQYKKVDSEILLHGGKGKVYIRSCDEPDYLEGMTITQGVWLDEAGQMSEKVWTNVLGRVAIRQAPILLTTTPYVLNWVYRDIYKRWQAGDKNYKVVQWTSIENPAFSKDEWEQRKATMNEADFARRYGGEWRRITGLVYPDFSYDTCVIDPIEYSPDWEYFVGIDWGFTNPTAVVFCGIDPAYGTYHILDEFYQSGKTATEVCAHIKEFVKRYPKPIRFYYCDPAGRDEIATFCLNGIRNIVGVKLEVLDGIRRITEVLRMGRLKVFKGCVNLIDELDEYHLPTITEGRNPNEDPVKKKDHLVDALRYLIHNTILQYSSGFARRIEDTDAKKRAYEEGRKWFENLGITKKKQSPKATPL